MSQTTKIAQFYSAIFEQNQFLLINVQFQFFYVTIPIE